MAQAFKFDLVSPEKLLLSDSVDAVVIPGTDGEMTVMANHAPVMTSLRPGIVTVSRTGTAPDRFVVFGGFADITPEACTLLAESAVRVSDIDRADLERRTQAAQENLKDAKDPAARARIEELLGQLSLLQSALS